jgi:hypothetical protein
MCRWLSTARDVTMRRFTFTAEDLDAIRRGFEQFDG